jgi:arginine decarboxylase
MRRDGTLPRLVTAPYPPGIPVIMPGERFPAVASALLRYLATSQVLDASFPGFATEIHGVHVEPDGSYRIACLLAVAGDGGLAADRAVRVLAPA